MISLKTVEDILQAISSTPDKKPIELSDGSDAPPPHGGSRFLLTIDDNVRIKVSRLGFFVTLWVRNGPKDKYYGPYYNRRDGDVYEFFCLAGPFSKIHKLMRTFFQNQKDRVRNDIAMGVLNRINAVVDLTGFHLEENCLKGKPK